MSEVSVKPTQQLHDLGQSIWLDNITRGILNDGTLQRYIDEYSVTGLTSNPTIFEQAIEKGDLYDEAIRRLATEGASGDSLFFALAIEDLTRAADLFSPIHRATNGGDGWVSLEVSPLLAHDAVRTVAEARSLHERAKRANLFIKIPGTTEGVVAIEEAIFAGVPINVTLLFSHLQYLSAAEAYLRGIERRIAANLDPVVPSVASLFVSRWDKAVQSTVPRELRNRLGIAVASRTYRAYRELERSARWRSVIEAGARPQRLLWASTGTKDPQASDVLYVEALAAPGTINTIPEATLHAFADHGRVHPTLAIDGGDGDETIAEFEKAGIRVDPLAADLQQEGAEAFVRSWKDLLGIIAGKAAVLTAAR